MLLDLIARYYKFLWIAVGAVAFFKIILFNFFNGNLEGVNGILYALFKWYGEEEQEMEDVARRRMTMRFLNLITIGIYFLLLVGIMATLLPLIFGR